MMAVLAPKRRVFVTNSMRKFKVVLSQQEYVVLVKKCKLSDFSTVPISY